MVNTIWTRMKPTDIRKSVRICSRRFRCKNMSRAIVACDLDCVILYMYLYSILIPKKNISMTSSIVIPIAMNPNTSLVIRDKSYQSCNDVFPCDGMNFTITSVYILPTEINRATPQLLVNNSTAFFHNVIVKSYLQK